MRFEIADSVGRDKCPACKNTVELFLAGIDVAIAYQRHCRVTGLPWDYGTYKPAGFVDVCVMDCEGVETSRILSLSIETLAKCERELE